MNHTYRLVWNNATQRQVPAPESARTHGKRDGKALKPAALALAAAFALPAAAQAPPVNALPTGAQIIAGQAAINQTGAQMTVSQGSDKAILHWNSFDIGSQASVTFVQPSSSAVALNRVLAGDASRIYGQLSANGQVWLINPAGVVFGQGSKIDVGSLVASTLDTTNTDFLAGKAVFSRGNAAGSIINKGEITAADGGLVALLAPTVSNDGIVSARLGNVVLAAGDKLTMQAGVDGLLQVAVEAATVRTLIENKQLIVADGGQVVMTGKAADALSASVVGNSGTVQARTIAEHEGRILLLADMEYGEAIHSGLLDASAPNTGNGGFIETSAAKVTLLEGRQVTTKAENGKTGTWLIDPNDYTIAASGGDITGTQLSTDLNSTSVEIQSSSGGTAGNGDIHVNDAVSWSQNTLTLTAARDININAVMTASGTSQLVMNTGTTNGADTGVAGGTVKIGFAAGEASGFAGRVDFPGRSGTGFLTINGNGYHVLGAGDLGVEGDATNTTLQGMLNNLGGHYALGANIDASTTATWNDNGSGGYYGFSPIGTFTGIFNGLGHAISGLTIDRNVGQVGLIGRNEGSLSNLGVVSLNVKGGWTSVGGLAGRNEGNINHAYVTGSVTNYGGDWIGGLVGENNATIKNSYSDVTLSGPIYVAGGLVGGNWGPISNSYATGSVTGSHNIGGLVGTNVSSISNSYATGSVTGSYAIGGLVGDNVSSISNSYATGAVNGTSDYVAGLVGNNRGTISNSYATGTVTDTTGSASWIGGLVGSSSTSSVVNSFWDTTTTGQASSGGGTGMTTAQMKALANFNSATADNGNTNPGWDISANGGETTVWRIYEGQTYPLLRSFLTPVTVTANNASKTYDGAAWSGGNGVTQSIPAASLNGTLAYGGTSQSATNAGSYTITPSGQWSTSYDISYVNGTLTIDPAVLTAITGNLTGTVSKTYNGTTAATLTAGNFLLTGWAGSDGASVTKTTGTYDNPNAGNGKTVTVSLATSDYSATGSTNLANYILPTTISGNIGSITPAPLTITANNASKTYDGVAWGGGNGVNYTGFVAGQNALALAGTLAYAGTSQGAADAGNYSIIPSGLSSSNYSISYVNGALTINPAALAASMTGMVGKTYNGTTAATLTAGNFLLTGWAGSDGASVTKTSGTYDNANAGTGKTVSVTLTNSDYSATGSTDLANYTLPTSISGAVGSIDPAPLTITANNAAKTYDGNLWTGGNGVSYSGFVNSETSTVLGGTLAYGGTSQGAVEAGNYSIQPFGLSSGNYAISYVNGTLNISPAPQPEPQTPPASNDTVAPDGGKIWHAENPQLQAQPIPPLMLTNATNTDPASGTPFLSLAPGFISFGDEAE